MPSITMMPMRARTLSALGALEERNGSMELYVGGASVAKSPIAIAQFVRGFARSCGACGVLGGGGRWCWQWRASGPGVGGYREPGPSREFKISAWCAAVVVGIGCVNQE
jgi:hypothetical protein